MTEYIFVGVTYAVSRNTGVAPTNTVMLNIN